MSSDLESAQAAFEAGRFKRAMDLIESLYPEPPEAAASAQRLDELAAIAHGIADQAEGRLSVRAAKYLTRLEAERPKIEERWNRRSVSPSPSRSMANADDVTSPQSSGVEPRVISRDEAVNTILCGVGAALGAIGCAAFNAPVLAYYVPLGFGAGALVLWGCAWLRPGDSGPISPLALILGAIALVIGIAGYSEFQDVQDQVSDAQQELEDIGNSFP